MLDDKDKLILEYLMHDCRITTTKLAKLTNLSQPSVVYRIKKLEKEYIFQYDVMIDFNKFDLPMFAFFIRVPNDFKEEFINWCRGEKDLVHSLIKHINYYNYSITAFLTEDEFKLLLSYLNENKLEYFYYVFKKQYSTNFSIFDLNIQHRPIKEKNIKLDLDEIDVKILNRLQHKGGKDSILDLAKHTQLTYDLVLYRYKKLKNAGYFASFNAQVNYDKLHIQSSFVVIHVKDKEGVVRKMSNIQKSLFIYDLGDNKYGANMLFRDIGEYKKIINRVIEELDENLVELQDYMFDKPVFLNKFDFSKILKK